MPESWVSYGCCAWKVWKLDKIGLLCLKAGQVRVVASGKGKQSTLGLLCMDAWKFRVVLHQNWVSYGCCAWKLGKLEFLFLEVVTN